MVEASNACSPMSIVSPLAMRASSCSAKQAAAATCDERLQPRLADLIGAAALVDHCAHDVAVAPRKDAAPIFDAGQNVLARSCPHLEPLRLSVASVERSAAPGGNYQGEI